jgi:predicted RNA-binding protein YlxR (DUF448 family)
MDRSRLLRLALAPDRKSLAVGALGGRGAWLCRGSEPCLVEAVRRDAFTRALRAPLSRDAIEALSLAVAIREPFEQRPAPVAVSGAEETEKTRKSAPGEL